MSFPSSGLPDRITAYSVMPDGRNADGDRVLTRTLVFENRPGRLYRDRGVESAYIREGVTVDGIVATKWLEGDHLTEEDALVVDGVNFDIVYPRLMQLWSRPSHWEIIVRRVG